MESEREWRVERERKCKLVESKGTEWEVEHESVSSFIILF